MKMKRSLGVFFSYSRRDEELRIELEKHLKPLERAGMIECWHDRHITAGRCFDDDINEQIRRADIVLLLISPDFLSSDYCAEKEVTVALKHQSDGQCRVVPVILRPADWRSEFGHLEALPTGGIAVTEWLDWDKAFLDITERIRDIVKEFRQPSATASPDSPLKHKKNSPMSGNATHEDYPTQEFSGVENKIAGYSTHRCNIPIASNRAFTGRNDVLTQIQNELARDGIAALTGMGGVGKTQTAAHFAYEHIDEYSAILWSRADAREALISGFVEIATTLGLSNLISQSYDYAFSDADEQMVTIAAVKQWLHDNDGWLLILDNAESLEGVRPFLPATNRGHILLTTRLQAVATLAPRIEIKPMPPDEGPLFLLRRAGFLVQDMLLEDASKKVREDATQIARLMDGLPLALEQAGAFIENARLSTSEYLELYRQRGSDLRKRYGGSATVTHHDSVAVTFSLAFTEIVTTNLAVTDLLRLCAALHPDEIPEQMLIEGADLLGENLGPVLIDPLRRVELRVEACKHSLLDVSHSPFESSGAEYPVFTMHRIVRDVLRDEMDDSTIRLWADRAVKLINRAFPDPEVTNWPACERLLTQAEACLELAQGHEIGSVASYGLLSRVGAYLYYQNRVAEAERNLMRAVDIGKHISAPLHPELSQTVERLEELRRSKIQREKVKRLFMPVVSKVDYSVAKTDTDTKWVPADHTPSTISSRQLGEIVKIGAEDLFSISIFRDLDEKERQAIAGQCRAFRVMANQEIVRYLEKTSFVLFVLSGRLRINVATPSGHEVSFREIGPGDMEGEFSELDDAPSPTSVSTIVESVIFTFPGSDFRDLLSKHASIALQVVGRLSALVSTLSNRVVEFSTLPVRNRIHSELLRLAKINMTNKNEAVISSAPTHTDIANLVSTHREAVTRELNSLVKKKLIARNKNDLHILDVSKLASMVNEVRGRY